MLRRLRIGAALALAAALLAPASAEAGVAAVIGSTIVFTGDSTTDQVAVSTTVGRIRFSRFGGAPLGAGIGCLVTDGGLIVDCPTAGASSIRLDLRGGDDTAWVSPSVALPVALLGGDGNDSLTGGGGTDSFDGGAGDDSVVARDGRAEPVDCGPEDDAAILDDVDGRAACERIEGDADGDGVRPPVDCDDTTPTIRPGLIDIPDNGVDEDCSGADAVTRDRDHDGVPTPQDCDDANAAVHPGLPEALGNALDEDCDTRIEPFPPISGSLLDAWDRDGVNMRNARLTAKGFPVGTAIEMRCRGPKRCPFTVVRERVNRGSRSVNLHRHFGRRALRPGVRLELRFSLSGYVGRVLRYRMTRSGLPEFEFLCLAPGERARAC